jgi:hypothetical protein
MKFVILDVVTGEIVSRAFDDAEMAELYMMTDYAPDQIDRLFVLPMLDYKI